ncbi:MAG: adenylosuccinate lyase, partial [Dehalococcoidia bacterium]
EEGVIPQDAVEKIRGARYDIELFQKELKETHHDMTAFLRSVYPSLGEESRYIHLGLTTSDIWDTALSLQMVEAIDLLSKDVDQLLQALRGRAVEHKDTVMIGRTHGVHAEPITLGLKLALWVDEVGRNAERLRDLRDAVAVGKISGAVGTYALVSPRIEERVCSHLGLNPAPVSNQIIQRDIHAQFVTTLALLAASLEKFATEIRSLQRTEILELEEPFSEGQTGSSAMPHKRNPDKCERVCGLARLLRGYAVSALEDVALWNERDISHSSVERIILPDSCLALDYSLDLFTSIVKGLTVYPQNMKRNLELTRGLVFSQRVLTSLIEKGLSRNEAYQIVQTNAMKAWKEEADFRELLKSDLKVSQHLSPQELESLFDYRFYIRYVDDVFKRLALDRGSNR